MISRLILVLALLSELTFAEISIAQSKCVGFADTIIYGKENYRALGYDGPTPIFIQIWFPLSVLPDSDPMAFGQLQNENVPGDLKEVYEKLSFLQDSVMMEACLSYELLTYQPILYSNQNKEDVLEMTKALPVQSYRWSTPREGSFPVIVYHHGTQGSPRENFAMAEYFARRGYVFISASFHLPGTKNMPFGWESFYNDLNVERAVLEFGRSMAGEHHVAFIGHSWGAQLGWCLLQDSLLADAFVSLETTLEFKQDMAEVRDKWPHMANLVSDTMCFYRMPVLAMAWSDNEDPFHFFKQMPCKSLRTISVNTDFDHEGYTSVYHLRHHLIGQIEVPDSSELRHSMGVYDNLLECIDCFLDELNMGEFHGIERCDGLKDFLVKEYRLMSGELRCQEGNCNLISDGKSFQILNPEMLRRSASGSKVNVYVAISDVESAKDIDQSIWILDQLEVLR